MIDNGFRNWISNYYNEMVYEAAHEKDMEMKRTYRVISTTLYYVARVYDNMECPEIEKENKDETTWLQENPRN